MAKKEFQAESKKLMDMMINSIYTNKEIFLRELISNASDAIDKLYYKSLTDTSVGMNKGDFRILLTRDKDSRTLTISDNGIGMTREELEQNLGTIAHSGSLDFKKDNKDENIDIIGQFGVGFYSAFMVADKVTVISKAYGSDEAWQWESSGADGYELEPAEKETAGTDIILHIKPDTETDNYDNFLDGYGIVAIVKKYSDYVRYPIQMEREKSRQKPEPDPKPDDYKPEWETYTELETLNSMVPIWKKQKSEVTDEEYANFYKDKFSDYADPARVIVSRTEGTANYNALLFVPSHRPYDFYTKDYEKGLALYASGVLIMEKCADLLPDYFSFVKGIVDSQDLSLNISREMLQKDNQLKLIHNALEKKVRGCGRRIRRGSGDRAGHHGRDHPRQPAWAYRVHAGRRMPCRPAQGPRRGQGGRRGKGSARFDGARAQVCGIPEYVFYRHVPAGIRRRARREPRQPAFAGGRCCREGAALR